MPKRGRSRKKTRTHDEQQQQQQDGGSGHANANNTTAGSTTTKVPKSLVIRRGKTIQEVADVVQDVRRMMLPYTAIHYKDEHAKHRKLTLQQYATNLALPMGISHIMAFSQSQPRKNKKMEDGDRDSDTNNNNRNIQLRLGRLPAGPTLQFRVHSFSLTKHIQHIQRRPVALNTPHLTSHPPIVVTNNFGQSADNATGKQQQQQQAPHIKLLRITFQNLFPAINVATVKLADCRRVVLFNLLEQDVAVEEEMEVEGDRAASSTPKTRTRQVVEIRHYAIQATPVGLNKKVKRLIHIGASGTAKNKKLPNLHNCQDIADYITGMTATGDVATASASGNVSDASDSEPEDNEECQVTLPGGKLRSGRSNKSGASPLTKSALKLVELGPRLTLELTKVEKGLGGGDVLYHAYVKKTPAEVAALKQRHDTAIQQKQDRIATQQANVERKRQAAETKRTAKRQRQHEREQQREQQVLDAVNNTTDQQDEDDDDDDGEVVVEGSSRDEQQHGDDDDDGDESDGGEVESESS